MTLPTPDAAFRWTIEPWGVGLRCLPLETVAQHVFTSRQLRLTAAPRDIPGGPQMTTNERGPQMTPNERGPQMTPTGPGARAAAERKAAPEGLDGPAGAWAVAVAAVGGAPDRLMRVAQVHGAAVRLLSDGAVARDAAMVRPDGDAIASNAPGLVLAVQVADCVPILMADARTGAVAAVHAGWRGTCAGIAAATVRRMADAFGVIPSNLTVAIGPSVGPADYVVGESVVEEFRRAGHAHAGLNAWFARVDTEVRLDLWHANRDQLVAAGVGPDRIFTCGLSTVPHPEVFDSYRRDGARAGRMAALIRVPGD